MKVVRIWKTQIGFGIAVAVLAFVGVIDDLSLRAYQHADGLHDQTLDVLGAIDRVLQVAVDAEFVVTGDEAFLEPRRSASWSVADAMARLRHLTADRETQRQRAERLGRAVECKLSRTDQVADARRALGFVAAQQLVVSSRGGQLMDEIRALCGEMRSEELALLGQREASAHRHGRAAEGVTALGSGFALLLLCAATVVNRRERGQRPAAEDALQRAHDEREVRVQQRTLQRTRANRSLRMLRECNQSLVRVEEETTLLDEICRAIVGIGGYRLAWVGCALHEKEKALRAHAGKDDGFLGLVHPTWADVEGASCPCGRSVRTGRSVVVRDVRKDPDLAPWRDEAVARGYLSVASLPLLADGSAFGVLTVYGGEVEGFDEEEVQLLGELASDVAFGLRTLRLRAERDRMQAQLVQADRLVSLGTLAAGVAHEINNPLTYVLSNLECLARELVDLRAELPAGRLVELERALKDVRSGAERIKHTARDLKTFSHPNENQVGSVNVSEVLDSSANMAHNEIRHRARLVKQYDSTPLIEGNDGRLGQVFLNLIVNAAHAIEAGSIDRNEIRLVTGTDPSGRAVVEVRDTGMGISPENLGRIFEPFFTTKPAGIGTGLGLFICKEIVAKLGGSLTVNSQPGRGSVFCVVLPPAPQQVVFDSAPPPALRVTSGRRGRVLVVDDELAVGEAIRRILSAEHDVVVLTSARKAHQLITSGERFDVILCDLMMSEMTGMDLHAELIKLAPDQAERMVVLTGGTFTAKGREFLQRVENRLLEKPFDSENIRAVVRELIS